MDSTLLDNLFEDFRGLYSYADVTSVDVCQFIGRQSSLNDYDRSELALSIIVDLFRDYWQSGRYKNGCEYSRTFFVKYDAAFSEVGLPLDRDRLAMELIRVEINFSPYNQSAESIIDPWGESFRPFVNECYADHSRVIGVSERFQIVRFLSRGAQKEVFEAVKENTGQHMTVKESRTDVPHGAENNRNLLDEAYLQARLSHQGIPVIFSVAESDGRAPMFVERYIPGKSWSQWLADDRAEMLSLKPEDFPGSTRQEQLEAMKLKASQLQNLFYTNALETLNKVAVIVGYAHTGHNIIHCDLKPDNVMINRETGEIYVIDWGMAIELHENDGQIPETKGSTIGYMPPEIAMNMLLPVDGQALWPKILNYFGYDRQPQLSKASDVFMLGAILYEIITGQKRYTLKSQSEFEPSREEISETDRFLESLYPTSEHSESAFKAAGESSTPESFPDSETSLNLRRSRDHVIGEAIECRPFSLPESVPEELAAIVRKAMNKNPENRFHDAVEFSRALSEYLLLRQDWEQFNQTKQANDTILSQLGYQPGNQLDPSATNESAVAQIPMNSPHARKLILPLLETANQFRHIRQSIEEHSFSVDSAAPVREYEFAAITRLIHTALHTQDYALAESQLEIARKNFPESNRQEELDRLDRRLRSGISARKRTRTVMICLATCIIGLLLVFAWSQYNVATLNKDKAALAEEAQKNAEQAQKNAEEKLHSEEQARRAMEMLNDETVANYIKISRPVIEQAWKQCFFTGGTAASLYYKNILKRFQANQKLQPDSFAEEMQIINNDLISAGSCSMEIEASGPMSGNYISCAFSSDGNLFASLSTHGQVLIWDNHQMKEIKAVEIPGLARNDTIHPNPIYKFSNSSASKTDASKTDASKTDASKIDLTKPETVMKYYQFLILSDRFVYCVGENMPDLPPYLSYNIANVNNFSPEENSGKLVFRYLHPDPDHPYWLLAMDNQQVLRISIPEGKLEQRYHLDQNAVSVTACHTSGDILVCTAKGDFQIYDTGGQLKQSLPIPWSRTPYSEGVLSFSRRGEFSPSDKRLMLINERGETIIWDMSERKIIAQYTEKEVENTYGILMQRMFWLDEDHCLTLCLNGNYRVLDLTHIGPDLVPQSRLLETYRGLFFKGTTFGCINPQRDRLLTSTNQFQLELYDLTTGKLIGRNEGIQTGKNTPMKINVCTYVPELNRIIIGGLGMRHLQMWDATALKPVQEYMIDKYPPISDQQIKAQIPVSITVPPAADRFALGTGSGKIYYFKTNQSRPYDVLDTQYPAEYMGICAMYISCSPDGKRLVSSNMRIIGQTSIDVWNWDSKEREKKITTPSQVMYHDFLDEKTLFCITSDSKVLYYDLSDEVPELTHTIELPSREGIFASCFAISPDKTMLAIGFTDGYYLLVNNSTHKLVYTLGDLQIPLANTGLSAMNINNNSNSVTGMTWSPDNFFLAISFSYGNTALVFAKDGKLLTQVTGHTPNNDPSQLSGEELQVMPFWTKENKLVTVGTDGAVHKWDYPVSEVDKSVIEARYDVKQLTILDESGQRWCARSSLPTQQSPFFYYEQGKLVFHENNIVDYCVRALPNRNHAAYLVTSDGEVNVWDLEQYKLKGTVEITDENGTLQKVSRFLCTPDGLFEAAISIDKTSVFFRPQGQKWKTILHGEEFNLMTFRPETRSDTLQQQLAVVDNTNGAIHLWDCENEREIQSHNRTNTYNQYGVMVPTSVTYLHHGRYLVLTMRSLTQSFNAIWDTVSFTSRLIQQVNPLSSNSVMDSPQVISLANKLPSDASGEWFALIDAMNALCVYSYNDQTNTVHLVVRMSDFNLAKSVKKKKSFVDDTRNSLFGSSLEIINTIAVAPNSEFIMTGAFKECIRINMNSLLQERDRILNYESWPHELGVIYTPESGFSSRTANHLSPLTAEEHRSTEP